MLPFCNSALTSFAAAFRESRFAFHRFFLRCDDERTGSDVPVGAGVTSVVPASAASTFVHSQEKFEKGRAVNIVCVAMSGMTAKTVRPRANDNDQASRLMLEPKLRTNSRNRCMTA